MRGDVRYCIAVLAWHYNIGVMYKSGKGVKQSDTKAMQWYTKAAKQGQVDAQCIIGVMFSQGYIIKQMFMSRGFFLIRFPMEDLCAWY